MITNHTELRCLMERHTIDHLESSTNDTGLTSLRLELDNNSVVYVTARIVDGRPVLEVEKL